MFKDEYDEFIAQRTQNCDNQIRTLEEDSIPNNDEEFINQSLESKVYF